MMQPGSSDAVKVRIVQSRTDVEQFEKLLVAYEASLPDDLKHVDFAKVICDLTQRLRAPNAGLLAEAGDSAAGCVTLIASDARSAAVHHLFVDRRYRGLGAGRALMEAFINTARERGFTRVVLDTHRERLQVAYDLYVSLGFVECEPSWEVDYIAATFMELTLT